MFEIFTFEKTKQTADKTPKVEVRQSGRIVFNDLAYDQFIHTSHVQLAYDRDHSIIGIKPCEPGLNTLPIKRTKMRGAYINALKFFKHYNIRPSARILSDLAHQEEFIVVNLNSVPTQQLF